MPRLRWNLLVMLSVLATWNVATAEAGGLGLWKRDCGVCGQDCCEKKSKKFGPADAPRGEVAFAVPGVVRAGQAVPVSDEAVRRGLSDSATREFRAAGERSVDERLDQLEEDMKRLTELTGRLTTVVESLDRKVGGR